MAEVQLYRIQFLQNNVAGLYIAGEVLDVYIDDTLTVNNPLVPGSNSAFQTGIGAIKVYRNGSLIGNGPLIDLLPGRTSIQVFSPVICVSTSLVVQQLTSIFPYAWYYTVPDHPSCAFNSPTCDLIMNGPPEVIPASGEGVADGEITINATSSNTIEYNLGSDFTYGNGQSSGTFSNLLPGQYRIFVRDDKSCAFNVLVDVGVDNTYGVKYRCEYTDFRTGEETRIEILERLYSSTITDVKASDTPIVLQLRGEGNTDKFTPVLSTQADVSLVSETDQAFTTLYTSDPNQYRVKYYTGGSLKYTGKVLPFIWQEDWKAAPYYVNITCTDGLPELKDYYLFQTDGSNFTGTSKLIKIIAFILKKINLGLNIRVAANIYATGMNTTASDDPFDQAYIEYDRFYLAEREPSLDFVLKTILEPFGARLIQWDNKWNIVRVEEMGDTYAWREYDVDGDYVSNGTTNPLVDIDYPVDQGVMFESFPSVEIQNGYGRMRVNYKLGLKNNLLENGDFRLALKYNDDVKEYVPEIDKSGWSLVTPVDYAVFDNYEIIDNNNVVWSIATGDRIKTSTQAGEAYIQSKGYDLKMGADNSLNINIRYNMKLFAVNWKTLSALSYPYIRMRIRIKYGSLYLSNSGNWETSETFYNVFIDKVNEYNEIEINANQPDSGTPLSGMNFDIRIYVPTPFYVTHQSVASLQAEETYDSVNLTYKLPNGHRVELRDSYIGYVSPISYDKIYYYELTETDLATSGYNVVSPTDYNATTNPRKWVLKTERPADVDGVGRYVFSLDKVEMKFLVSGNEPIDTIVRTIPGEKNNRLELEKDLLIGSSGDLIVTQGQVWLQIRAFFPRLIVDDSPTATRTTINILSSDLIYTGWLRSSTGTPYDLWARDGIAESERLHGVWLKMASLQYNKSWRLMRATLTSRVQKFGMLSAFRDVNDGNKRYIPVSVSYDDKNNSYQAELLELRGSWSDDGGSDGSGTAPFNSAFTTGFGSAYN